MNNLPKDPTLEDLTKEQLIYLIRYELPIRSPSVDSLRYVIWHVESERLSERMNTNLEAGNKLIGGKTNDARRAYLENLKEFDKLQKEWVQLSQYFDTVVLVKESPAPIKLPTPPTPIRIVE